MGILSKEEYIKAREENFAEISDEEQEKKELRRFDSEISNIGVNKRQNSQKR